MPAAAPCGLTTASSGVGARPRAWRSRACRTAASTVSPAPRISPVSSPSGYHQATQPPGSAGRTTDTLVANPDLLMPGLKLVGRQTPTAGGPLDLLGVDRYGRLTLFELKRGTLTREAVAQVIDYAADLESMDLAELAGLLAKESGERGIDEIEDFEEWYGQRFGEPELTSLRPLRMFLVGLGADERAERMVDFLANNSGMDISLITFHGFAYGGKTLLARQVHVEGVADSESRSARRHLSVAEKKARLDERAEESGVTELLGAVREMFRENWPVSKMHPGALGLSVKLQKRSHARIDVGENGEVRIVFFPRAKALCPDEFEQPVEAISHTTWPLDRDPLGDADAEIHFRLTAEDWAAHKETLTRLVRAVHDAQTLAAK